MSDSTLWWLFAGIAVALELLTGTFHLLMLAIGLAAAALAAHAGASEPAQLAVAAVAGGSGVVALWQVRRAKQRAGTCASPELNFDVGQTVQVDGWNADGTATVQYRGAQWSVTPTPDSPRSTGPHRVTQVVGNRLVVEKA